MKQTSIQLTDEQYKLLKQRSKISGVSCGSIIRTLLTDFFNKEA